MGFDFGLEDSELCMKRKNRWLFRIPNISASGVNSLPPSRASRPGIGFKEMEASHLTETIYFPGKPDWKTVNLTLYEIQKNSEHPIFEWIKKIYDPEVGTSGASCDGFKELQAFLEMYDGCGNTLETWVFESVWPQNIEFGDLDFTSSDVVVCDITLRYDRAYIL